MILFFLQSVLLIACGFGLFFLWRAAEPAARWLTWIVAAGFLARAVAGQALFWISWARLPILRSLQLGNGFWVFAEDAPFYFSRAARAAEEGARAIIFYDPRGTSASASYVQLLASAISLLGEAASVGILLNLFCYLGTILLLVRWSRVRPSARTAAAVAVVAISLSPSLLLWSLQPLKDSFFQLLFVAFVAACAAWQRAWSANEAWWMRAGIGAMLAVSLFFLAGIRWYVAGALVAAASFFVIVVAFTSAERRWISIGAAAIMIVAMTQCLVFGAAPYLPPELAALLTFRRSPLSAARAMDAAIEQTRIGFDATPAGTMIKGGARLTIAATSPLRPKPQIRSGRLTAADATTIRALLDEEAAAWSRGDLTAVMDCYWRSPNLEIVSGTSIIRGWERAAEAHRQAQRKEPTLRIVDVQLTGIANIALVSARWQLTSAAPYTRTQDVTMSMRRFPNGEWKIVREEFPLPRPAAVNVAAPPPSPRLKRLERVLVGTAVLVLPSGIGERLGLFEIGGGRGLLWFTDIDTLVFDLVLLFALWTLFAARRTAWRNSLTWLVLLTVLAVAGPLVYSISNFGTLFRLREIIYLGLLLIPICANCPKTCIHSEVI